MARRPGFDDVPAPSHLDSYRYAAGFLTHFHWFGDEAFLRGFARGTEGDKRSSKLLSFWLDYSPTLCGLSLTERSYFPEFLLYSPLPCIILRALLRESWDYSVRSHSMWVAHSLLRLTCFPSAPPKTESRCMVLFSLKLNPKILMNPKACMASL